MSKKKPVGWRKEHARHVAAGRGIPTVDPMDKLASKDLTEDAWLALDDIAVEVEDKKLIQLIRNWDDRMTYRHIEKALDRGLHLAPGDYEDRVLNVMHTLDKESERYKK